MEYVCRGHHLILYTAIVLYGILATHPCAVMCAAGNDDHITDINTSALPQDEDARSLRNAQAEPISADLLKVLDELKTASLGKILKQVNSLKAESKLGTSGGLFDISWMDTADKRIFQNFITWYKMILVHLNALNPRTWNLDFVVPAVGSVVSLYTGPILALMIVLALFFTLPTFVQSIVAGGGRNLQLLSPSVSHFLSEIGKQVDDALQQNNVLYED